MGTIEDLLKEVQLPEMVRVRQKFDASGLAKSEIPMAVSKQLEREEIRSKIRPGMRIAITVGSRGIANLPLIIRSTADFVKRLGAVPFLVPAMGSHGGATSEGQRRLIEGYGVTEAFTGCEIVSSMETVLIGKTENDMPVRMDKNAYEADGIIVCGRIKPHTAFRGPYESGIMKMMAIGLGKQAGAEIIHRDGFGHFREYIPMFGKVILRKAPVVCGLAILENAYDETKKIVSLTPREIVEKEPKLLLLAKRYMPRILFDRCDVLIVDEIGKNISGDGMDPNISGRFPTPYADGGICAQRVAVLDLAERSHGNACGIGLADVTTRRLFEKMDFTQTYPNAITNTVVGEMKIPMVMESDQLAIQMALKSCTDICHSRPRVIRIHNTLELGEIQISEAMLEEAKKRDDMEILERPQKMAFDQKGNLF